MEKLKEKLKKDIQELENSRQKALAELNYVTGMLHHAKEMLIDLEKTPIYEPLQD